MTTPSFFSHDPANAENDSGVPICQPTARGSSSPVIPPPAVARRVKRPYNKKPPQPRLPPATCTPRSSSPSAPSSVVGFAAQMTQIPSSNTSIPAYPVMPETCPSASYTQPSQSSSVTEEASSDSGTDDDSYFKCDDLFKLSEGTCVPLKARLCMCDRLIPKCFVTCPVTFMSRAAEYEPTMEHVNECGR